MDSFNNREIAIGIWLGIITIFCVLKFNVFGNLKDLFKVFFCSVLLPIFVGLALWLVLGIVFLHWANWWGTSDLKSTVFWYLFSGAALLGRSIQSQKGQLLFSQFISDQFKIIAALELVVVFYSFSLLNELWFVPVLFVLGAMLVISEGKPEYAPVRKLLEWVLVGITIFLIYHFVMRTISDKGAFWNLGTARGVTIPIVLSIWVLPYCYVLRCYSRWQEALIQIDQKTYHSDSLRKYARKKFRWALFLRPVLLKRAVRQFNMLPAKTKSDIRDIIKQVRQYENDRPNPQSVPEDQGWCPYAVETFLRDEGFNTGDFHNSGFDDEWYAESDTKYLEDAGLFETLIYRAKGQEGVVKTLQLKGRFDIEPPPEAAIEQMENLAINLIKAATTLDTLPKCIKVGFDTTSNAHEQLSMYKLGLTFTLFDEANIMDAEFTISVKS